MSSASDDFGRDNGLIHEVVVTGRKAGWGKNEWGKLAHNQDIMEQIAEVLNGRARIERGIGYYVDMSVDPQIPEWKSLVVDEHTGKVALWWSADRIRLHRFPEQESEEGLTGWRIRRAIPKLKPLNLIPLNATGLDYLLAHQHLIPEEWKKRVATRRGDQPLRIHFFGTVYRNTATGKLNSYEVRYLVWYGDHWHTDTLWIGDEGDGGNCYLYTDAIAMLEVS